MEFTRRSFLQAGTTTATALAFSSLPFQESKALNTKGQLLDELYKGFQNPPMRAKPFVRWWWNGDRLSKKEILRELDVLYEAGIGGVEINPIKFPAGANPVGYETLQWLSDEWIEMLKVALDGARERGMVCDMIVGSGWPFGGEFLEKEEQTQMVTIETIDLEGGKSHRFSREELLKKVDPEIHSRHGTVYRDMLMIRLFPAESDQFTEGVDLSSQVEKETISVEVPPGKHVLYYVVKLTGYMAVINGAPGAAGPVLNHYNRPAVKRYLNRLSDVLTEKIGPMGDHFRAMFCDSMELEGANWNDDLPEEFERRRGYSLLPYLPFVLKKVGHMGNPLEEDYGTKFPKGVVDRLNRVGLDFYKTRLELFKERFIRTFNEWCHENGVQSRVQAYGRGMHPLDISREIDIPDCETWLRPEVGSELPDRGSQARTYGMINKYVSSGARLSGKRLVSCEETTNTQMVFMTTLEMLKITGDQSNLSGVTHSILHGFNYSPPEAPYPGWVQYGTWFSERNPWWPYFNRWTAYKARLSWLFQESDLKSNVAILQPLTDLWLKHGPQRDPFPRHEYPDYQHNLWEVAHSNGDGCDYISNKVLHEASFDSGSLIYNQRSYQVLLIPETETLDLQSIAALDAMASAGGIVVFVGKKPFRSPDHSDQKASDNEVVRVVDKLFEDHPQKVILYPSPKENLLDWYSTLQKKTGHTPLIQMEKPDRQLSQIGYDAGDIPIYFFVNSSKSRAIPLKASFPVGDDLYPWIWNPETGKKFRYETLANNKEIQLEIPPATSLLVVFEKKRHGVSYQMPGNLKGGRELTGPWRLILKHVNGDKREKNLDVLVDFLSDSQLETFAGEVVYKKDIHVDNPGEITHIDLGDVQGVSALSMNGEEAGVRWYGKHTYDVSRLIKKGNNLLSVTVTITAGNYLRTKGDRLPGRYWTSGEPCSAGMMGPVRVF